MFRVETKRFGTTRQVFTWEDPRIAGYKGKVEESVGLDYAERVFLWPDGTDMPAPCLGRSRDNTKPYKVFKYRHELDVAGYEYVSPGAPLVFGSWQDYVRLRLDPPPPDEIKEEADWYNYLDDVDEKARMLRKRSPWPDAPKDTSRDSVAEWLAKQHFITDPTIREIWYLPQGAPPNEIRLLEVSERVLGNEEKVEPFDFGVEELGAKFRLSIADISRDQFEHIQCDPGILPPGWVIDGNLVWRRRDR